jgi:hypothetical protein
LVISVLRFIFALVVSRAHRHREPLLLPKHYIFNHIPKTGGISLLAVCGQNLDPAEISPHLGSGGVSLAPVARFEHYKLIQGHFSVLAQAGVCRSRYSMTLLRDPIRRIFSTYTFWRTEPENPWTAKAKELPFADFVRYFMDSPAIVHNPYTHHLAAIGRDCGAYSADESALLAVAKRNLAAFNFVGICEEFSRSVSLLCAELGWRAPSLMPHQNRTASEDRFGGIDSQTMEILRDRNRIDLELYKFAVQLFHAREAGVGTASSSEFPDSVEPNHFVPFPAPYDPNRRATIQWVSAEWVGDESSRILEIAVAFKTRVPIAGLSLDIRVVDVAENIVWSTDTSSECLELDYEPGRDCRAAFLSECALPRGIYFVTVALSELRRIGFYDHWINHATSFMVAPPRLAPSRYVRGMRPQEFSSVVIRHSS